MEFAVVNYFLAQDEAQNRGMDEMNDFNNGIVHSRVCSISSFYFYFLCNCSKENGCPYEINVIYLRIDKKIMFCSH